MPVLLLAGVLATVAPDAAADEARIDDPKDVTSAKHPNALDIRSAAMEHDGKLITHTITLYRGYDASFGLYGEFYLGVAFDTDGDASDIERILYIFSFEGHLNGQMVNDAGHKVGALMAVEHPNSRTAVALFEPKLLGKPDSYGWFAFANSDQGKRCCFDSAPNRKWVLHDVGAPQITEPNLSPPDGFTWESSSVPVEFGVVDVGGSGLESWSLLQQALGTTAWTTSATGTGEGTEVATLNGADGTSYQVCVQAVDRAGNVANGDLHVVTFPFDDAGGGFSYSGTWESATAAGDHDSTHHASSELGATASVTFSTLGFPYLVMPPGFDGTARVVLNGIDQGVMPASLATSSRQLLQFGVDFVDIGNTMAPYTITFTVESGTLPIDGLVVLPSLPPPPLGQAPTCGEA